MPIPLDQFTEQLVASGLLSMDEVSEVLMSVRAEQPALDAETFARLLVKQQKLTSFQAQQIYAGKGKHLAMGNYLILDKLGQGGMGMVFKAEHRQLKRTVALKVLSPAFAKSRMMTRRFQREIEATAKLSHPNIVTAYDAGEANGTQYLVLQYIEGTNLAALVDHQGPLSVEKVLCYLLQTARGLEYAHRLGVVHRDIKPANLLLGPQGIVKVLDMGMAKLDPADSEQVQLTRTGHIMGTVDYMAPEQAMDSKTADARADIYSLGITLWYLLTGRPVYDGETIIKKLMAHQSAPIPSLCRSCPSASPELEAVFEKMVAKTPKLRHQSMAQVIADLACCAGGSAPASSNASALNPDSRFRGSLYGPEWSGRPSATTKLSAKQLEKPCSACQCQQAEGNQLLSACFAGAFGVFDVVRKPAAVVVDVENLHGLSF